MKISSLSTAEAHSLIALESTALDVFADIAGESLEAQATAWASLTEYSDLRLLGGRLTVVLSTPEPRPLPPRVAVFQVAQGVTALRRAKRAAALAGRGLLVLLRGAT